MATVVSPQQDGSQVLIPEWIIDNTSFLRWAVSDDAPSRGKIGYFQHQVWIDQTMETAFHNCIKSEIAFAVTLWARQHNLGHYFVDGMMFSCPEADLSTEPDGMFVLNGSKASGKVWLEKGKHSSVLFGVPDMVLEVVSKSSKKKDFETLLESYHQAGISEYWLVNSLVSKPALCIYQHNAKEYAAVQSQSGWVRSEVLGASFRLTVDQSTDQVLVECQP